MALSNDTVNRLEVGLALDSAGTEVANAINANTSANALSSGQIAVGNASNVATPVSVTGDVTLSNAGVTALAGTSAQGLVSSSATKGVGYATGAGGAVTQITSATTGVTLSKMSGQITTVTQNIAHGTAVAFTVTNTLVGINDTPYPVIQSGSNSGNTIVACVGTAAGSYVLQISNLGLATAETGTLVLNVNVIKGVAA